MSSEISHWYLLTSIMDKMLPRSSALKMEALGFSEIMVTSYHIT